jgi:hypothetical protein
MFKLKEHKFITNIKDGKVISIKDRQDKETQPVVMDSRRNQYSHMWRILYTNKMTGADAYTKKGKMSKRGFGFIADEPFYLRSKLPMQRVAECVGASNVTLKKWAKNRKAQQWRFDPVSKTIKGMYWTSYGFSMESNNLRCRTLTSKWN